MDLRDYYIENMERRDYASDDPDFIFSLLSYCNNKIKQNYYKYIRWVVEENKAILHQKIKNIKEDKINIKELWCIKMKNDLVQALETHIKKRKAGKRTKRKEKSKNQSPLKMTKSKN